ncbi:uncharacterized protein EV154DRAFT_527023 [Mucor mucedo]|uniref:uncharacterized protein n=1 Tax=Mucor mucedo TaxID=29922 RepID=UPI00221E403D|nr:uncharacterized protein EV154DRAFT_527023 [Mucor mucedo]KAI7874611.1 hypothetical protein EV154DRAFT_527023 [Mucor mucedo]
MGVLEEFKSRNFSLYAQWLGVASIALLIALGVINVLGNPIFAILGWVIAFILFFVEVPLCTKFCPTSPRFDGFVARFENSYFRGAMYLLFSVIMFISTVVKTTTLVVPAVTLLLTFLSYVIAGLKNQPHASTKILGGTGVDNVV